MDAWVIFALITVFVASAVAAGAVRDRRISERAAHRLALVEAFEGAIKGSLSPSAVEAMTLRGWTVTDARDLGRALVAGIQGGDLEAASQVRGRVANQACRYLGALSEKSLLRGSGVPGQVAWIALLAVQEVRLVEMREDRSVRGMLRVDGAISAHGWQAWHAALGPFAPYAAGAGLSLDEAKAMQAEDGLDLDVLMALGSLRGVVLPAPALPEEVLAS